MRLRSRSRRIVGKPAKCMLEPGDWLFAIWLESATLGRLNQTPRFRRPRGKTLRFTWRLLQGARLSAGLRHFKTLLSPRESALEQIAERIANDVEYALRPFSIRSRRAGIACGRIDIQCVGIL